ncbi:FlgN protein [Pelosinus fermentans]|nr:FlgN family protein [Pelosinus fermentans DSM 17108]SDQ58521.1 FlgN protein [Pelosinus fermentans]
MILQEKYELVDELFEIVEQLVVIYTSLKVSNGDKQRVLAAGNLADLQMIAQQEEKIASIIAALEERRITLQGMIDHSHTSFNQLIALLEEPRRSRGIAVSQELRQLVKEMNIMQEANSIVLHNFLKLENHKRNVLFKVSTVPEYGGNNSFGSNHSIFNKIV